MALFGFFHSKIVWLFLAFFITYLASSMRNHLPTLNEEGDDDDDDDIFGGDNESTEETSSTADKQLKLQREIFSWGLIAGPREPLCTNQTVPF